MGALDLVGQVKPRPRPVARVKLVELALRQDWVRPVAPTRLRQHTARMQGAPARADLAAGALPSCLTTTVLRIAAECCTAAVVAARLDGAS